MVLKHMELAYAVEKVVREDVPKLHHECDGLIYTNAENGYAVGTDQSLWVFQCCVQIPLVSSECNVKIKMEGTI